LSAKLFFKPEVAASGFSFFIPSKADTIIVKGMKRKISPRSLWRAKEGQIPECFIGGSILLSKGGSIQISVEGAEGGI